MEIKGDIERERGGGRERGVDGERDGEKEIEGDREREEEQRWGDGVRHNERENWRVGQSERVSE